MLGMQSERGYFDAAVKKMRNELKWIAVLSKCYCSGFPLISEFETGEQATRYAAGVKAKDPLLGFPPAHRIFPPSVLRLFAEG